MPDFFGVWWSILYKYQGHELVILKKNVSMLGNAGIIYLV